MTTAANNDQNPPRRPERHQRALAALRAGATVVAAARRAGLSRQHVHRLLRADAAFAEARRDGRRAQEAARVRRRLDARERRRKFRLQIKLDGDDWEALYRQARELELPIEEAAALAVENGVAALDRVLTDC